MSSKDCVVDDYLIQSFCQSDDFLGKNCKQEMVAEYIAAFESVDLENLSSTYNIINFLEAYKYYFIKDLILILEILCWFIQNY